MKKLIFLLLFGLFLLGPPGELYADSNLNDEIEMVSDFNVDADFYFVNCQPIFAGDVLFVANKYPRNAIAFVTHANLSLRSLKVILQDRDNRTGKGLYKNAHLKIAGTDRICGKKSIYILITIKLPELTKKIQPRIRGQDIGWWV